MKLINDLPFAAVFLGFGCSLLLSALWPNRFARGSFGAELRGAKNAGDRRVIRTLWGIGRSGLFLFGGTMIARYCMPGVPDYLCFVIALVLIFIPALTTYLHE